MKTTTNEVGAGGAGGGGSGADPEVPESELGRIADAVAAAASGVVAGRRCAVVVIAVRSDGAFQCNAGGALPGFNVTAAAGACFRAALSYDRKGGPGEGGSKGGSK